MNSPLFLLSLMLLGITCTLQQVPNTTTQNGSIYSQPLSNVMFSGISINISLGTPPQNFTVSLDSTRDYLWVPDVDCSDLDGAVAFNSTASTTYMNVSGYFSIYSNSPGLYGSLGMDTFSVGGASVQNATFARAYDFYTQQLGPSFIGFLGLAFPEVSFESSTTSMAQILADPIFESQSFSLFLSPNFSTIILGGIDSKYAANDFFYVSVIGNRVWSFLGTLSIEGVAISNELEIVVDTTQGYAFFLNNDILNNFKALTGLGFNTNYELDILEALRPVEIQVSSGTLVIPPSAYMSCDTSFCQLNIAGQPIEPGQVTVGQEFLNLYYTHFDYAGQRIGFAEPVQI